MRISMKAIVVTASALAIGVAVVGVEVFAQAKPKASPEASVSQTIGTGTKITINYHRPGVRGRDVWNDKSENERVGALVPKNGDPRPWRAGANQNTKFTVSTDVTIEGEKLAAGEYGLFMIPPDDIMDEWIVVFSNNSSAWGSFSYKKEEDALRVTVQPVEAPHQEWLMYGFDDLKPYGATAYLHWEKVKAPFRVEAEPDS